MYVTGPPTAGPGGPDGRFPLPLAAVVTRSYPRGRPYRAPGVRILTDLGVAHGLTVDVADYRGRTRSTYTEMVADLAGELASADRPIGLVVLAHGTPDAETQWPSCWLAAALPGEPLSFAVADHGIVTPFLALRVAAAYVGSHDLSRAAVVILEQTALLRDPAGGEAPEPTENRATALIFDRAGELGELRVQLRTGVCTESATGLVRARLANGDRGEALVVGGALARGVPVSAAGAGRAVAAPAGLPCTGPWTAFAAGVAGWRRAAVDRVRLIDHEPRLDTVGECVVDLARPQQVRHA
ncbi:hypothetical protein [Micromonospora maris]|uniref:hypothetical protein n=1 Tax=Micromonospora maris TaxID=1003110 RepID=UPI002E0FC887|nr:hypothetical protein OG712_23360 [Micromonospora maris]